MFSPCLALLCGTAGHCAHSESGQRAVEAETSPVFMAVSRSPCLSLSGKPVRTHLHPGCHPQLAWPPPGSGLGSLSGSMWRSHVDIWAKATASANVLGWMCARYVWEAARKPDGLDVSKQTGWDPRGNAGPDGVGSSERGGPGSHLHRVPLLRWSEWTVGKL